MPTLTPVEHDPFEGVSKSGSPPFQFVPVDHDPFASNQDDALAASMTHIPEQLNPAQPYLDTAKLVAGSGLSFATGGLKSAGVDILPDWMNTVGEVFQNPDNQVALGVKWRMAPVGKFSPDYTAWRNQRSAIGLNAAKGKLADPVKLDIARRDRELTAEQKRIAREDASSETGSGGPKGSYGVREWRGRSSVNAPEPGTVDPEIEKALMDYMKSQNLVPVDHDPFAQ